ncbi:MAG: nucleotide exchange factor GrpE [Clostridiales bacterium]|nr:nucleotide exchange factor GrpE [Clostridiales bacterium]
MSAKKTDKEKHEAAYKAGAARGAGRTAGDGSAESFGGEASGGSDSGGEAFDGEALDGEALDDETLDGDALEGETFEGDAIDGEVVAGDDGGAEEAQESMDQLKDRILRLNADFDNFRKRTQREKLDWGRYASQSMIEKLLPVADNMDAAMAALASAGDEAKSVSEGFVMIHKQLVDVLANEGLTEIPALGEAFDPNVHEAVMMVSPAEGQADNQVVMVVRKGYMFKDKVLRPAMVQVAKS